MFKKNQNWIWIASIVIAILLFKNNLSNTTFTGAIGDGTLSRSVSSTTVQPSSTFTVKYQLTGGVAPYYYIIRDTINSGGCTFVGTVDNKVLPTTLSSPATSTVDFTVNTPSTVGTCTLSGYSKLGDAANAYFQDTTINVCNAVNGGWTTWGICTSCSQSRTCTNPTPSCGGANCVGLATQSCGLVNGGWSVWSVWSDPILNCGTRTRTCTNPTPSCGGANCVGLGTETLSCVCSIVGDTYPACNGINIGELGILAQAWINAGGPEGTLLNNLAIGAQDWINNGGPE